MKPIFSGEFFKNKNGLRKQNEPSYVLHRKLKYTSRRSDSRASEYLKIVLFKYFMGFLIISNHILRCILTQDHECYYVIFVGKKIIAIFLVS